MADKPKSKMEKLREMRELEHEQRIASAKKLIDKTVTRKSKKRRRSR